MSVTCPICGSNPCSIIHRLSAKVRLLKCQSCAENQIATSGLLAAAAGPQDHFRCIDMGMYERSVKVSREESYNVLLNEIRKFSWWPLVGRGLFLWLALEQHSWKRI